MDSGNRSDPKSQCRNHLHFLRSGGSISSFPERNANFPLRKAILHQEPLPDHCVRGDPGPELEWIEKTYPLAFRFGRFRLGRIRLRTRQLWTPFAICRNALDSPRLTPHDLQGVDAVYIPGFPVVTAFPILQFRPGMIRFMIWNDTRFLVAMSGTFESYLQSRSSATRRQLRRAMRRWRAATGQDPTLKEFRGAIQMREFYAIAGPLSQMTWQGEAGAGLEEFASQEDVLPMAEGDRVRGYLVQRQSAPGVRAFLCTGYYDGLLSDRIRPGFCRVFPRDHPPVPDSGKAVCGRAHGVLRSDGRLGVGVQSEVRHGRTTVRAVSLFPAKR